MESVLVSDVSKGHANPKTDYSDADKTFHVRSGKTAGIQLQDQSGVKISERATIS
jgi:hypothetical protein